MSTPFLITKATVITIDLIRSSATSRRAQHLHAYFLSSKSFQIFDTPFDRQQQS